MLPEIYPVAEKALDHRVGGTLRRHSAQLAPQSLLGPILNQHSFPAIGGVYRYPPRNPAPGRKKPLDLAESISETDVGATRITTRAPAAATSAANTSVEDTIAKAKAILERRECLVAYSLSPTNLSLSAAGDMIA